MSALVVNSDTTAEATVVWIIAADLGDRRVVHLFQGQNILGAALIASDCLVGPGRDGMFRRRSVTLRGPLSVLLRRCLPEPPTWVPGTTIPRRSCANRKATS